MAHFQWTLLPAELRLTVLDHLDVHCLLSFSTVSKDSRALSVPRIFRAVSISSFHSLQEFLATVPLSYLEFVCKLGVCTYEFLQHMDEPVSSPANAGTPHTDALIDVLSHTPQLQSLTLQLSRGLHPKIMPYFSTLEDLIDLKFENCQDEETAPLSEGIVADIALSVPRLRSLSLARITRALRPSDYELYTSSYDLFPAIVEDNPTSAHRLPDIFSIPTLRHLSILDTHLGDPRFARADLTVSCALETLELGAYTHASPEEAGVWFTRILARAGQHLKHVTLGAGLLASPSGTSTLRLSNLESARLTASVSPSHIPSTLVSLANAGASMKRLDMECSAPDFEDVVEELSLYMDDIPAEACTGVAVRVRVMDSEQESCNDTWKDGLPVMLGGEGSRRLCELQGICARAGAYVTLVGAVSSSTGDQADSSRRTAASEMDVKSRHAL